MIEIKTFTDKRSRQQLMCINQHSGDTLYAVLSPTISSPLSGRQEFPGSLPYGMKAGVTFHFVLFLFVTDVWGNLPFWPQLDLSIAIKGKYKAVGGKGEKKPQTSMCQTSPARANIHHLQKRGSFETRNLSHTQACTESHARPFFISLISSWNTLTFWKTRS